MTTNILPINTLTIRASAVPDTNRRKTTLTSAANGGAGKWWTPLFGFSNNADYIDNNTTKEGEVENIPAKGQKFTPGCFTEEKARMLRMRTKESFHDVMYHSAIASRLASDFTKRDGQ